MLTGHTHKYEEKRFDGTLFLNPGSCGPRKLSQAITMAILYIHEGNFEAEKIEISHVVKTDDDTADKTPDLKKLIKKIMKDTDKKKSVEDISRKRGEEMELVKKIVRLYLTHPGIDAEGIMEKMG